MYSMDKPYQCFSKVLQGIELTNGVKKTLFLFQPNIVGKVLDVYLPNITSVGRRVSHNDIFHVVAI